MRRLTLVTVKGNVTLALTFHQLGSNVLDSKNRRIPMAKGNNARKKETKKPKKDKK